MLYHYLSDTVVGRTLLIYGLSIEDDGLLLHSPKNYEKRFSGISNLIKRQGNCISSGRPASEGISINPPTVPPASAQVNLSQASSLRTGWTATLTNDVDVQVIHLTPGNPTYAGLLWETWNNNENVRYSFDIYMLIHLPRGVEGPSRLVRERRSLDPAVGNLRSTEEGCFDHTLVQGETYEIWVNVHR